MTFQLNSTDPDVPIAEELQLGQFIPLHYHFHMLQDQDRVGAFAAAINHTVHEGMQVLELGTGTGILSSFAARRGAKVTCVERNPALAKAAERLLAANGLSSQTDVCLADAMLFVPEQPVDVVICEMLHVAMLREKQLQVIDAFKRNYRRRFGQAEPLPKFIPEASFLMWQPIYQSFDYAGYWAPVPVFQAPLVIDPRTTELASLDPYAAIFYEEDIALHFNCQRDITVAGSGCVNAIRFVTQNVLAVDVSSQSAMTWPNQCLVLPLLEPIDVQAGQRLSITFRYDAGAPLEQLSETLHVEIV